MNTLCIFSDEKYNKNIKSRTKIVHMEDMTLHYYDRQKYLKVYTARLRIWKEKISYYLQVHIEDMTLHYYDRQKIKTQEQIFILLKSNCNQNSSSNKKLL